MNLRAEGIGTVHGKLFLGTAEKIPSFMASVLKCHLKKCCRLLQKWRLLAVELSEPELVCHIEQIRASPHSCKMGAYITRLNALLPFLIEEYDAACPQKPRAIVPRIKSD
ncbi:hypothetical protein CRG98_002824 [Punica granatum]|nr:hypothetical protein CRG98_002824 [Punica granatum]